MNPPKRGNFGGGGDFPSPLVLWQREVYLFICLFICLILDAFDREYSAAYREIQREYSEILHPDDKSPSAKAVFCREAFEAPTLQPRRPIFRWTWSVPGMSVYEFGA